MKIRIFYLFSSKIFHTVLASDMDFTGWPLMVCVLVVIPCHNIVDEIPNNLATLLSSSLPKTSTSKDSSPNLGANSTFPMSKMALKTLMIRKEKKKGFGQKAIFMKAKMFLRKAFCCSHPKSGLFKTELSTWCLQKKFHSLKNYLTVKRKISLHTF